MTLMAAIQMASGPNVSANLLEAERLLTDAAKQGVKLAVLPENFAIMGKQEEDTVQVREIDGDGVIQTFLSQQAAKHSMWIVGGTIPVDAGDHDKARSVCYIYDDKGQQAASYDKIHLFDVKVPDGESYLESKTIIPGDSTVVVETPFGKLGVAICYDLRFPELFRELISKGAEILAIPSAFTAITGKAHWEILLRARAVENLSYVLAANQGGYHISGRETFGDSMLVDPWGTILARHEKGAGLVVADVDVARVQQTRAQFPVIEHRKLFCKIK